MTLAERLNGLRNHINAHYGYLNGTPRINLGPCGRFAQLFHEEWNKYFYAKVAIAFLMSKKGEYCYHVLVRLPDGQYFDGGNGVMSADDVLKTEPAAETRLENMAEFDVEVLRKRSYGLTRHYPLCPNYSDQDTRRIIRRHLATHDLTEQTADTSISGSLESST